MKKISSYFLFIVCTLLIFPLTSCYTLKNDSAFGKSDVAKIIIEAESSILERIEKLREKYPQNNYYANPVNEVHCLFFIQYTSESNPEEIVKKHKLYETFPNAEIKISDVGKSFTIRFKRDDFTEDIHNKIKKLAKSEPLVNTFYVTTERYYDYIMLPKIEYYEENAVTLNYEETDSLLNRLDRGFIIKSKTEYDEYINLLLQSEDSKYIKEIIERQKDLYDDSFFADNALIITKMIVRGSGSTKLNVDNIYLANDKVYVVVQTEEPNMGTCDVKYATFTVKVKQSDVINVDEVVTLE